MKENYNSVYTGDFDENLSVDREIWVLAHKDFVSNGKSKKPLGIGLLYAGWLLQMDVPFEIQDHSTSQQIIRYANGTIEAPSAYIVELLLQTAAMQQLITQLSVAPIVKAISGEAGLEQLGRMTTGAVLDPSKFGAASPE